MTSPRAFTEEETRALFLETVRAIARYWSGGLPESRSVADRCDGVAFSILSLLDGSNLVLPGFKVIPNPHPDDRAYHEKGGCNWFSEDVDIGGSLHEEYYKR